MFKLIASNSLKIDSEKLKTNKNINNNSLTKGEYAIKTCDSNLIISKNDVTIDEYQNDDWIFNENE